MLSVSRYSLRSTTRGVKRKLSTIYREQDKIIKNHENSMKYLRKKLRYPIRSLRLNIKNRPQWQIYREISTMISAADKARIKKRNEILVTICTVPDEAEETNEQVDELDKTIDEESSYDSLSNDEVEEDDFRGFNWDQFNTFEKIPNVNKSLKELQKTVDSKYWVSATGVKNWIMKDPVLDWYNTYYDNIRYNEKTKKSTIKLPKSEKESESDSLSILFEKGHLFEAKVVEYINKKFPGEVVNVATKSDDAYSKKLANQTKKLILKGTPIITQAVLHNKKNLTFGIADILIRSDYINKLTDNPSLLDEQETLKAPKLKGNYHYLVIDIKWTTIPLRANGFHILTSGRFPAYKGQLAIYNAALMDIQGLVSLKAFILGKRWTFTSCGESYESDDSFDRLGCVDYGTVDRDYLKATFQGINWIRDVKNNGHKWTCLPTPSRYELYPNMSNPYDAPWHQVKYKQANKLKELTLLWYCGPNNRYHAHMNGIKKWTDKKCTPEALGICGEVRGPVLAEILDINDPKCKDKIHPKYIIDNTGGWQIKHELDFYVDFEAIHHQFYTDDIDIHKTNERSGIIFMVGVGYEENGKWKYKDFTMTDYDQNNELKNFKNFMDFLTSKQTAFMKKYNLKKRSDAMMNLYHWGHIERTQFANLLSRSLVNKKYVKDFNKFQRNIQWIDFNRIFQREPITIKGTMNFSIKTVGKAMYKHKMIKSIWKKDKESPKDGLAAMMVAIKYYKFKQEWDKMDSKKKKALRKNKVKEDTLFKKMTYYNEMDCKVLYEIVEYLRDNHIDIDDIDDGDQDYDPDEKEKVVDTKNDDSEDESEWEFSDED